MPESRFDRNEERYPELHHLKLSRKSIGMKETELMNLYSKEFNHKFDARFMSVKSQETQYSILDDFSKNKQLEFKPIRKFMSKMSPRSLRKNVRNDNMDIFQYQAVSKENNNKENNHHIHV